MPPEMGLGFRRLGSRGLGIQGLGFGRVILNYATLGRLGLCTRNVYP